MFWLKGLSLRKIFRTNGSSNFPKCNFSKKEFLSTMRKLGTKAADVDDADICHYITIAALPRNTAIQAVRGLLEAALDAFDDDVSKELLCKSTSLSGKPPCK